MGKIGNLIQENIQIGRNFETTLPGKPKILHWFQWKQKRLNIYHIVQNRMEFVDLDIDFKIPSFARSIIIPTSEIFLIGGEEPEY